MALPPTGTVTFLFTDIEGSTRRWELQRAAMSAALARHDELLRQAVEAHDGYVFKTVGDAFYSAFASAGDALLAALEAQTALSAELWPDECQIRVRMALHTGVAEARGGDYYGPPLNRVARLLSAAHGGQVLLSMPAQELVRDWLPAGVELRDLGEHRLKDLTRHEHVFQVAAPGLPSEFGPLRTLENRPNNLPLQPTAFIGRERELDTVVQLLRRPEIRLLTLTGAGGTGKTRMALQAAAELLDEYEDGSFFVSLAAVADPGLVAPAIAAELGLTEAGGQPVLESVRSHLRELRVLLVLDNFEQVMGAASVLPQLLAVAPGLNILVTSRAALRIRGEQEFAVPPLTVPDFRRMPTLQQLSQYDAVRLFIERARNVKPDFEVTSENAPAVAEICSRLDGLPLAIELAAARVRMLPPQAMLARLQSRLKLLTGGARDLPARQRTLRGAMDWSYELLSGEVQTLFAYLAVFAGGGTLEAAETICNPDGELDVLGGIEALVENSLLRQEEQSSGEARFAMLETIHEYAWEQLEASGDAEDLRSRQAAYFLELAEAARLELAGAGHVDTLVRLDAEHDNLRAALAWARQRGDLATGVRLAGALWEYWWRRGHLTEGRAWLDGMLHGAEGLSPETLSLALQGAGMLAREQGDYPLALSYAERSLALNRERGDRRGVADALNHLAVSLQLQGDVERTEQLLLEALGLYRELGDPDGIAKLLNNLANLAMTVRDYPRAGALLEEGLALQSERRVSPVMFYLRYNLGMIALAQGQHGRASARLQDSLRTAREVGTMPGVSIALHALAAVAAAGGDAPWVAKVLGAADRLLEFTGTRPDAGDFALYQGYLAAARQQLGEERFLALYAEGHAMPVDEAVALALRWSSDSAP